MTYKIAFVFAASIVLMAGLGIAQTNAFRYGYVDPSVYDSLGYDPSGQDTLVDIRVNVGTPVPSSVVKWDPGVNTSLPLQVSLNTSSFPGSNEDLLMTDAENELDTAQTWWNEALTPSSGG